MLWNLFYWSNFKFLYFPHQNNVTRKPAKIEDSPLDKSSLDKHTSIILDCQGVTPAFVPLTIVGFCHHQTCSKVNILTLPKKSYMFSTWHSSEAPVVKKQPYP